DLLWSADNLASCAMPACRHAEAMMPRVDKHRQVAMLVPCDASAPSSGALIAPLRSAAAAREVVACRRKSHPRTTCGPRVGQMPLGAPRAGRRLQHGRWAAVEGAGAVRPASPQLLSIL